MKKITVCFLLVCFCLILNAQKTYYVISFEDSTIENIDSFILQKQAEKKDIIKKIKKNHQRSLAEGVYLLIQCKNQNNKRINKIETLNYYIYDETNSILVDSSIKELFQKDDTFQKIYTCVEDKYNGLNQINFSISYWKEDSDEFEIFYFILGEIIQI